MANYTDYLSQAQGIFGDPNAKSPLSSYLENQGISAGKRAGQGAIAGLAKSGFGGSTFAQPISQQASTIAQQPYIQQATQTQQQDSQQRWQKIRFAFYVKILSFAYGKIRCSKFSCFGMYVCRLS